MKLICPKCKQEFCKASFFNKEITIATNSIVITPDGIRVCLMHWECCVNFWCTYELKNVEVE